MFTQKLFTKLGSAILVFFLVVPLVFADELCTPFKKAAIDQSLIATMLNAAKDGHLYRVIDNTSQMGFCVESSIGVVKGEFQKFKGGIALNGEKTLAMLTIDVDSLETDASFIKSLLKGDDFFNVDEGQVDRHEMIRLIRNS